jgi:hypothetical protein
MRASYRVGGSAQGSQRDHPGGGWSPDLQPARRAVTLVILTVISMVRLTQSLDQMAGRPFDECHERERNRIRCNPCA